MKNALAVLFLLSLLGPLMALTVYSSDTGGNWSSTSTWFGGRVPNSGDDVVINSTVYADPTGSPHQCANLTVVGSGTLMNQNGCNSGVTVNGSLTNHGITSSYRSGSGNLTVTVADSITNSGSLTPWHLDLNGMNAQHLSNSGTFRPSFLEDLHSGSPLVLDTDLEVSPGVSILMNNASLVLNGSSVHHMIFFAPQGIPSLLQDAQIVGGNGASITCNGGAYLMNSAADEIVLQGMVEIKGNLNIGHLINNGEVYNKIDQIGYLSVMERLDNHGTISNHSSNRGNLALTLYGDLYNYGTLTNRLASLAGSQIHHLWQSTDAPAISCANFTSSSTVPARLISDLRFSGTAIDFSGNQINLHNAADECFTLNQTGGSIRNAVFSGGASGALNLNALYVENVSADRVIFGGSFELKGTVTAGILINNAILCNVIYQNPTISVTQRLDNHGTISNHSSNRGNLALTLYGDLYNYGTLANHLASLAGSQIHHLWQSTDAPAISCANFTSSSTGPARLISDLRFNGTTINFSGNQINLYNAADECFTLNQTGGSIRNAVFSGGASGALNLNALYVENVSADRVIFGGSFELKGTVTAGILINNATLCNVIYQNPTLSVTQRLENYGTISNHSSGGNLALTLNGDLYNFGMFGVYRLLLNGTTDQYVHNAGTINTGQGCQLVSELGPAQWYFNGSLANANLVTNQTVNPYQIGIWRPYLDGVWGRQIIFGEGSALTSPVIVSFTRGASALNLTWTEVPNAICYRVYSAPAPTGPFTVQTFAVHDTTAGDGLVSCEIQAGNSFRFYRVSALN